MSFLALTTRPLHSRGNGYDVRVSNLCAHLPGDVHHVVAPYQPGGTARPGLVLDGVFASSEELAPLPAENVGPGRHLRLSNTRYLARTRPRALAAARSRLATIVRERGVTHVVVFGAEIAELAVGLPGVVTVLDVCDSSALTVRRERARGVAGRLSAAVDVARKRRTEARFPRDFDLVTAISAPDARAVEGRGAPHRVAVVPNGLDQAYVRALPEPGDRRGVVFWGNLAFGPNRDALRFLVDEVFLPRLRDRGVELCVVGAAAPSWLEELAADDPSIVLCGFVDDLPGTVSRYPVMVNPMRSGSGLKNKVLEAFGLGLAVVSTPLGVEALPDVVDGTHVVGATDGEEFAAAVLALLDDEPRRGRLREAAHSLVHGRYLWGAVGERWHALVTQAPRTTEPHDPGGRDSDRRQHSAPSGPHSIV